MRMWPPGWSWYSWFSAQHTRSGQRVGTVTAMRPPGRSTRTSSAIATVSAHTCSSTSDVMMQSKVASGKGSASASPCRPPPRLLAVRELAGVEHLVHDVVHALELLLVAVERDDRRAAPPRLVRVPAAAATHVEEARRRRATPRRSKSTVSTAAPRPAARERGRRAGGATVRRCRRPWRAR